MKRVVAPEVDQVRDVVAGIELPLMNAEFAIEEYLLENGPRLDTETRILLAAVRDCLQDVSDSTRRLTRQRTAA